MLPDIDDQQLVIDEQDLKFYADEGLIPWLQAQNASLVFTTYQSGKVFMIGVQPTNGRLSVYERTFNRVMGLCATPQTFYMTDIFQCWRFENVLLPGQLHNGYDRLFVPQASFTTGDIDIHDIALNQDGKPVFITTLFNCLATISETHSFMPLWKPSFISTLAAEDRCHLNGLAMKSGKPIYVTAVSQSDIHDGWRNERQDGGVVIDIVRNQVVVTGLSMPHSPRIYRDRLWLINSGTGDFGYVRFNKDGLEGQFHPLTFCPGYARGLCFSGNYAIIGLSEPRDNSTFCDLSLDSRLHKTGQAPRCGLLVVDLSTGDIVHRITFEGVVKELYDVAILPGVKRPMLLGLRNEEIYRMITIQNQ